MLPLTRSRNRSRFPGLAVPQSALDLDFLSGTLDPRITFTRASSGTFFDSNGLLQTAANDVPRFDYDPVTLAARGLLIEEQRTNLLLYNSDLTDATWVKTNITAARNQVGIDGSANTATRLTASAANGTVLQTITSTSAARATSAYVRRVTGTGTVEMTQDNGVTWTTITVPATWGRVTIPSATLTNPTVGFRIVTSGDAIDVDYIQCENGAFATSAIATSAATATRAADLASMTGTNFSSWYNATEGTLFVEGSANIGTTPSFAGIDDTTIGNIFRFSCEATKLRVLISSGGSLVADLKSVPIYVATTVAKIAGAYNINDFAASFNGETAVIDTSGNVMVSPTRLLIGSGFSSTGLNGYIRRIVYWPVRVPNSQLQFITA